MKKIQDLKPHEAIEIRNKKEAKKLCNLLNKSGITRIDGTVFNNKWLFDINYPFLKKAGDNKFDIYDSDTKIKVIYNASYFLPKKKKWKKEAFSEIARLDSEVNELRHMLSKDIPVTVTEDVKLEVGKWYFVDRKCEEEKALICYQEEISYGFGHRGKYIDDYNSALKDLQGYIITPAKTEEVISSLIKEAERRGYKEGVIIKDLHTKTQDVIINMTWHSISADLRTDIEGKLSYCIYHNGKWAEIVEQPKDIDWTVPGQLVEYCGGGEPYVVIVGLNGHTESLFNGTCIKTSNDYTHLRLGEHIKFDKRYFKPYTGEPIILKP